MGNIKGSLQYSVHRGTHATQIRQHQFRYTAALLRGIYASVQIRPATLSDIDQLAPMLEALWPQSSAYEHAQELRMILGGKAALVVTLPIAVLVAEASNGQLVGFVEVDLRSHADGCDPKQ